MNDTLRDLNRPVPTLILVVILTLIGIALWRGICEVSHCVRRVKGPPACTQNGNMYVPITTDICEEYR